MRIVLLVVILACISPNIHANPSIVAFLQQAPISVMKKVKKDILKKFDNKNPSQISKKLIKAYLLERNILIPLNGFLALYKGYSTYSNHDGLIIFPIRHIPADQIFLAITPSINLENIDKETYSDITIPKKYNDTKLYLFSRQKEEYKDDTLLTNQKNKKFLYYWKVTKQDIPEHRKIPSKSIILLTKPQNIFVAEGDFFTKENPNIVLPENIFIIGRNQNIISLFTFLKLAQYFEPMTLKHKKRHKSEQSIFERL